MDEGETSMTPENTPAYFLSSANPIANADQLDVEARALRLLQMPALQHAREKIAFLWRLAYGESLSGEAEPLFDAAMDEYQFNYVLKAAVSDGNYPQAVRIFMPPHEWFGRQVQGSRIGGDNPDNCYRVIGIAHGARYEVEVRPVGTPASSATFVLVGNYACSKTIQTLDASQAQRRPDGSFTITIDSEPAQGRANHLRTTPGVKFLFVRDSMNDWAAETPYALSVRRLDAPTADPLPETELAERAAEAMADDVPLFYWFSRLCTGKPVNALNSPRAAGALGGLVGQASANGWFRINDDEAIVVTFDPAGAAYCSIVAHDLYFCTIDYWERPTCLNGSTLKPDADGSVRVVMSIADPGVHNWLDTGGLHEVLIAQRWQGLPPVLLRQGPTIATRMVKFDALASLLPKDTATVTPQQRQLQQEQRLAAYRRRLIEN